MTNSLKSQLELTADASGVEAGVSKAKKSLASLGATAAAEGQKAAAGIDKIGAGGENASKKVDKTTRSLIASIERTTATLEAGGRANTKYFETLAAQRGVDVTALRPYLDQLDAVSKRQGDANVVIEKGGKQLNAYGISAKQTAAAMRGVPAQLTDIITGLSSGQAPLTVLIQQGGQLKDMFGGVVPAARALGGAVMGLINPYTLAAGAVVAIGLAYAQGSKEADAYAKALILSGNAAGTTVGQLTAMAQRIDGVVGTQAQAAEALSEFAANGNIAGNSLERFATVAIRMEKTTGQAVKETVKQFAELGKSPVEAAVKLNESTNFLTESIYKQIRALENQGRTAEAAAVVQKAYADAMDQRLGAINDRLGIVERGWRAVKSGASEAWDAMLGVGRQTTLEDKLAQAQAKLAQELSGSAGAGRAQRTPNQARVDALRAEIDTMKESIRLAGSVADRQRASAESVKARVEFDKEADKYLSRSVQMEREIAKFNELADKAGASRLDRERGIAAIKEKFKDSSAQDIIDAKITVQVDMAQAIDDANFKEAQDLAEAQIKAMETERRQVFETIDQEQEQAIADAAQQIKYLEENAKKAEDFVKSLGLTFVSSFEDAIVKGGSVSDMLKGIEQDIIRISARKLITEPLAKGVGNFASGINLGSLFGGGSSSIPIDGYAGGGFTGSGARSGGLDGQGGFLAMLHPQETVTDHTRSLPMMPSGAGAQITYSPVINIDSRTDRREVAELVDRSLRSNNAQLVDQLRRQGRL